MLTFVKSVLLCSSVGERTQEARWEFISHRFSQMNRSLSANRGNSQTPASRRQISQSVIGNVSCNALCYRLT